MESPWRNIFRPWPTDDPGPWTQLWLECVGMRDMSRPSIQLDPDWYCIHVVERGSVRFQIGDVPELVAKQGDLFALWPHIPHAFRADPPESASEVRLAWVRLRGALARPYMEACGLVPEHPVARARDPKRVADIVRRLIALAEAPGDGAETRAVALLYEMAGSCGGTGVSVPDRRPLAIRVREAMERDVAAGRNVEELARAFGVSRSTLFLHFREAFGKTPVEVLIETRLARGRELLEGTDRSIREVALASGYGDALYFSRQFHEHVGIPPGEYRKRQRNG